MFDLIKQFWSAFLSRLRKENGKREPTPLINRAQNWREIARFNLLAIYINKLNNYTNTEATFEIVSDSTQADELKRLCTDVQEHRYEITSCMLADGDYFAFPALDKKNRLYHSFVPQSHVRIIQNDGDNITEAYAIIDVDVKNNKITYLVRHHLLTENGTLIVDYNVLNSEGAAAVNDKWADISGQAYAYENANHIGFGWYRSPTDKRGSHNIYGVPLNYGCGDIEDKIFNDFEMIEQEFKNAERKIFADESITQTVNNNGHKEYSIIDSIFTFRWKAGQTQLPIDTYSPDIRQSSFYDKLINDLGLHEKQIGTSKGILTDNESLYQATATAVKRANADTIALIEKIRTALDNGNRMTLEADAMYMNVANDLWAYKSDWYDPFEDPAEQWQRLLEAKQEGVEEAATLTKWLNPNLSDEEVQAKLDRIGANVQQNTDDALERILRGG